MRGTKATVPNHKITLDLTQGEFDILFWISGLNLRISIAAREDCLKLADEVSLFLSQLRVILK